MGIDVTRLYFMVVLVNAMYIQNCIACSSAPNRELTETENLPEMNLPSSILEYQKTHDTKIFTNLGYTLRGYNILLGNPFHADTIGDPGFQSPIFKVDGYDRRSADNSYNLPNGIDIYPKQICRLDSRTNEVSNEKEYQRDLLLSTGLSGGLPDVLSDLVSFAFSANSEYKKKRRSLSEHKNVFVKTENTCTVYEVVLEQNKPPKFTDGFLRAAKRLENAGDTTAYFNFVNDYGTHYLRRAHMGARYAVESEVDQEKREEFSHDGFNLHLGAKLDFLSFFKIESNTDTQRNTTTKETFQRLRKENSILTYGSPIPKDGDAITWANEVRKDPLPIRYTLSKITNLFDERFMENLETPLNYVEIKKQLTSYLDSYCENEKQNLGISKCSPPNGGCEGGNDCHHNAECINNPNGNGLSEYTCACKEGYQGNGKQCSLWHDWQTNLTHNRYQNVNDQSRVDDWGVWQKEELCPENEFAYQFSLKVEPHLGHGSIRDDSALNGVKLYCKPKHGKRSGQISSGIGAFGSWTTPLGCLRSDEFLDGYRFQSRVTPNIKDNWFGENIEFSCQGRDELLNAESKKSIEGAWVSYGEWSSVVKCPEETSAICGVQTKIHPQNPDGWAQDEAGLTDVKFLCCKI